MYEAYGRIGLRNTKSHTLERDNVSISNSSITSNTSGKSFHSKRPRYSNRNLNQDTAHNPSIPLAQSSEGVENPNEDTSILESNNSHAFCILSVFRPSVSSTIGVSLYESGGELDNTDSLQLMKATYHPDLIIASCSLNDPLYADLAANYNEPEMPFQVLLDKKSLFSHGDCRTKLNTVSLEAVPDLRFVNPKLLPGSKLEHQSHQNSQHKTLRWISLVDFSKIAMVSSLSGLLSYLSQNRQYLSPIKSTSSLQASEASPECTLFLNNICPFPIISTLYTDISTQRALNIFMDEVHPGGGRKKEGLSIFGVLNQTKTGQGARLLKYWLQHPSTDQNVIESRLDHIEFFTLPSNEELLTQLRFCLSKTKDVPRIISRFLLMTAKPTDWVALQDSIQQFVAMNTILRNFTYQDDLKNMTPNFTKGFTFATTRQPSQRGNVSKSSVEVQYPALIQYIAKALPRAIVELNGLIIGTIDSKLTEKEGRVIVRSGIHPGLDALKGRFAVIGQFLADVLRNDLESGELPPISSAMHYCYFPQLGYLLAVPIGSSPDLAMVDSSQFQLELQIQTEEYSFYSTPRTRELDHELGDIQAQIFDLEREVVHALWQAVVEAVDSLEEFALRVAELDVIVALGVAAKDFSLVRPKIVQQNGLHIVNGRHMLYELCMERFIPNTTTLYDPADRDSCEVFSPLYGETSQSRVSEINSTEIPKDLEQQCDNSDKDTLSESLDGAGLVHVLTGPNNSGKSVFLKQIGIITYLAHVGSFIPAESAVIGICDKLLARIPTADSVTSDVSTFARDISQMSLLLRNITSRSLILSDEFGSGTNTFDGIALCTALLNYLTQLSSSKSKTNGENNIRAVGTPKTEGFPQGCPKTLVVTHFHEMFTFKLVHQNALLRFRNMSFMTSKRNSKLSSQAIIPLFKLTNGWSDNSYGFDCAKNAGLSHELIARARDLADTLAHEQPVVPSPSLMNSHSITDSLEKYAPIIDAFIQLAPTLNQETADSYQGIESLLSLIRNTIDREKQDQL